MTQHAVLTAEDHRDLRVRTDAGAELGDGVMACLTFPDEFRRVQGHFPILFRLDHERDRFSALAMLGLEEGENLFLAEGLWDASYKPLSLAIQPFLVGSSRSSHAGVKQVHVDLGSPRIAAGATEGTRVFEDDGRPSPFLEQIAAMLGELDAGYQASGAFFDALRRHELLEPMVLDVPRADGSTSRLVGFHMIDEARLQRLDAQAVAELHGAGHLMPIFMAVASLGRLSELIARKTRGARRG